MLLAPLSKYIYNPDISYPPPLFQFIIISHLEIWNTHITSLPTSILQCSLLSVWQLNEFCHLSPHALQWLFNPGRTYIACPLLNASNLHLLLPALLSYTHLLSFLIIEHNRHLPVSRFSAVCAFFSRMLFLPIPVPAQHQMACLGNRWATSSFQSLSYVFMVYSCGMLSSFPVPQGITWIYLSFYNGCWCRPELCLPYLPLLLFLPLLVSVYLISQQCPGFFP